MSGTPRTRSVRTVRKRRPQHCDAPSVDSLAKRKRASRDSWCEHRSRHARRAKDQHNKRRRMQCAVPVHQCSDPRLCGLCGTGHVRRQAIYDLSRRPQDTAQRQEDRLVQFRRRCCRRRRVAFHFARDRVFSEEPTHFFRSGFDDGRPRALSQDERSVLIVVYHSWTTERSHVMDTFVSKSCTPQS